MTTSKAVNLFLAELTRFWTRRMTWIVMGLTALILTFIIGIAFTQTSGEVPDENATPYVLDQDCVEIYESGNVPLGPGDAEASFSEEEIESLCQRWTGNPDKRFWAVEMLGERYFFSGEFDGPAGFDDGQTIETWSDYIDLREDSVPETTLINGVEYRDPVEPFLGYVSGPSVFYMVLAVLLGGSFIGAEFRAGTMENLLLWEPRRTRVMLTKFAVGFLSSATVVAVLLGFFTGLLSLLATFNGTWQGVDGRFWWDLVMVIMRISVVAGLFSILAMAVATITRHTAAAIAAVLGWFALSNILIELAAKWLRPHELFVNALAFVGKGEPFKYVQTNQGWDYMAYHHGYLAAGLYVAAWALIPGAFATYVFRRRDLT